MKKFFSICTSLFLLFIFSATPFVFSASMDVSRINIIAPTTAKVGEAIDITLRAVDKNDTVVTGYRGSVIFNTDGIGDTLPSKGSTIPFSPDDNGEKKFSKGVIFKKAGKQKLSVFDLTSDSIAGEVTINVEPSEGGIGPSTENITIITPDNNAKISENTITISGKTRKNSKVIVKLNGQQFGAIEVSDADGVFTKNITDITQESNIVVAQLVDSSNKVFATSQEVKFTYLVSNTSIYGVTIKPSSTVEASSMIDIIVDATPGISELSIKLDGSDLIAKEAASGKYSIQTIAPLRSGFYKLTITEKNSLGQTKTSDSPTNMTVTAKPTDTTSINGVIITPSSTIEVNTPIDIMIDATPKLTELSINLDGTILMLSESASGKYSVHTVAPQKAGLYKFLITYKNASGATKTSDSPTNMTVTEKPIVPPIVLPPSFKNIKTVITGSKIVFDFFIENTPVDLYDFKIVYSKNNEDISTEVTTYPLEKIPSFIVLGGYRWYIDDLSEGNYTFQIFGRKKDGSLISNFYSELITGTIGKDSCSIGNITDLFVKSDRSKSVISWSPLTDAVSYNLYKVSPSGDYTLFQNTTEPTYTLYLSTGAIVYENFAVKALCDSTTESAEYSSMSHVQSGPGMIAIIVIISTSLSFIIMRRRYSN